MIKPVKFLAQFNDNADAKLYYNNNLKIATTATGIDVTGVITTDGMTTSADINFGDNDKAIFGAGSDLQIYHDESNSYIKDAGSGDLIIQASDDLLLESTSGENYINCNNDGSVEVFLQWWQEVRNHSHRH